MKIINYLQNDIKITKYIDYKMSSNTNDVTTSVSAERLIGRVKWFNNKTGYGFITISDGEKSGSDIFAHHSSIYVDNSQYKYLVQGEYVEFELLKPTTGPHEFHACNISGIKGGKLLCETRHEFKLARTEYKSKNNNEPTEEDQHDEVVSKQKKSVKKNFKTSVPKSRGEGPRDGDEEWKLVNKKSVKSKEPLQQSLA